VRTIGFWARARGGKLKIGERRELNGAQGNEASHQISPSRRQSYSREEVFENRGDRRTRGKTAEQS